ncbi:unnamed protein product, partial [Laminaria digitata]
ATSSESCSGGEGDETAASGGGGGVGAARGVTAAAASAEGGVGVGVGAGVGAAAAAAAAGMVPSANRVYYVVDPKEVMVDKNAFMCPFLARSPQLLVPGMLKCTFSTKSNRLSTVQFSFDPTVPARQLARAAMLQGRATPGMAGMVAGMLGMGGVDVTAVMGGGGAAPAPATAKLPESRVSVKSETATTSSPPQGFVGQDEGVLHSVLEDIREWRVSSTLVDDPKHGKSFLRVYPLSGDTPGVTHFIGVLEVLSTAQPAAVAVAAAAAATAAMGEMAAASSAGSALLSTGTVLGENSSGLEAGASEGETSSDSTSSGAKQRLAGPDCGSSGSGSGCSDDGTGEATCTISIDGSRSSGMMSAGATTCSDGGFSSTLSNLSGYETRRSTRRLGTAKGSSGSPISPTKTCASSNSNHTGGGNGNVPRARVRVEGGTKRGRS